MRSSECGTRYRHSPVDAFGETAEKRVGQPTVKASVAFYHSPARLPIGNLWRPAVGALVWKSVPFGHILLAAGRRRMVPWRSGLKQETAHNEPR